jgi:site-specific DNA-methyltransferase (cytosine-N4-specific)
MTLRLDHCHLGDCREAMRSMIAEGARVQTIVTSPPYWGLRDYGVSGQIGQEDTPREYVATMVEVFALARELLADDGTLWLNLGDRYVTTPNGSSLNSSGLEGGLKSHAEYRLAHARRSRGLPVRNREPTERLGHKNLVGIPWRVAFALQDDGWILRQDIIWHKPNPMPESVTDRCTKAHEYLFLFSRRPRYYFDQTVIREPAVSGVPGNRSRRGADAHVAGDEHPMPSASARHGLRNSFARESKYTSGEHGQNPQFRPDREDVDYSEGRNRRSVWTVPTRAYRGAHFAVFPPVLIAPCILAGSRPGDIVLDPFLGSGTTAQVAQALGRHWIGCELNPDYLDLQSERVRQSGLPLGMEAAC